MAELYALCMGRWVRYEDIVEGLMGRDRKRVRANLSALYRTGRMERRASEDGATEYRSVPGMTVRDKDGGTIARAIREALRGGPMTTREAARSARTTTKGAYEALAKMERRGIVLRAGRSPDGMVLWRLPRWSRRGPSWRTCATTGRPSLRR